MNRRGSNRGVWSVVVLLVLGGLAPSTTEAQQWHELYTDGLTALQNRQGQRAVELLERAIEERPQPGRLVPTYGTNFVPRYFPHLRLAEAYLLRGAAESAADALRVSARFGIEPVEEREAIEARVRAAIDARAPPSTLIPLPERTPTVETAAEPDPPAPPEAVIAPPPPQPESTEPTPAAVASPREETLTPPRANPAVETDGRGGGTPTPPPVTPRPRAAPPALEITSDPPGARVFLDDEPVGRTDPETGRLRLTTLTAGRHRVRLSSEGREDVIREVEIGGDSVAIEARLSRRQVAPLPVPAETGPVRPPRVAVGPVVGVVGIVVGVILIGLLAWGRVRQPAKPVMKDQTPSLARDPGTDEMFPVQFGDYSLVRRIGKGGMAVVYEAVRHGEALALKRPLTGFLDDDRSRERFLREADLGRTLHHPNVIRIFDHGRVGETPYFTMELVRGETLAARLDREGRLDLGQAARLTAQVAEALDYAHSKGVIHRDLKPSNIMIEPSGTVKVMDYGIARATHMEELTATHGFLGTPSYGAPETLQGGSQPASDVYSLGVIFFEMLTGSLPFTGDTALAVVRHHSTTPAPPPSSLNHSLSAELDRLVLCLLSKDPSDRPTAEKLRNELSDYLAEGR